MSKAGAASEPEATGTERKRLKKSSVTRARILDAAAFVFHSKGYALARLSDIAKRARTQTGSIYYYFPSREAVVAEVLNVANERTARFVQERLAMLPPTATARERIEAAIHGHLALVLSGDRYVSAHMRIFDQIPRKLREHFLRVLDEYSETWRSLLLEARAEGDIREDLDLSVVRLLLLGMMNWSLEWYKSGERPVEEIARHVATLLFDGVRPRPVVAEKPRRQRKLVSAG